MCAAMRTVGDALRMLHVSSKPEALGSPPRSLAHFGLTQSWSGSDNWVSQEKKKRSKGRLVLAPVKAAAAANMATKTSVIFLTSTTVLGSIRFLVILCI